MFMNKHITLIIAVALGCMSAGFSTHAAEPAPPLGANKAIYDYLGAPVAVATNMPSAYTKEGLISALQAAAGAADISLKKLEIDDSEFPFVVGVICSSKGEMEKLKDQIRRMPIYSYTGGVGGGDRYAMNLVHHTAFPADARERIRRRVPLREQILFERLNGKQ